MILCSSFFLLFRPRRARVGCFQFLEQKIEAREIVLPNLPETFGPVGYFLDGLWFKRAKILSTPQAPLDEPGLFEIGEMFGDGLLRDGERRGQLLHTGWSLGKPLDNGSPGGIGQSGKSEA